MAGLQGDIVEYAGVKKGELEGSVLSEKGNPVEQDVLDELPTTEEKATLRRVPDSIPWNAYREISEPFLCRSHFYKFSITKIVIAVVELAERFSYYGSTVVFVSCISSHFVFQLMNHLKRPTSSSTLCQLRVAQALLGLLVSPELLVWVSVPPLA